MASVVIVKPLKIIQDIELLLTGCLDKCIIVYWMAVCCLK